MLDVCVCAKDLIEKRNFRIFREFETSYAYLTLSTEGDTHQSSSFVRAKSLRVALRAHVGEESWKVVQNCRPFANEKSGVYGLDRHRVRRACRSPS